MPARKLWTLRSTILKAYMFQLTFPVAEGFTTPEIWTFNALVLAVDPPTISPGKAIKFSCKLQVTGARTMAPLPPKSPFKPWGGLRWPLRFFQFFGRANDSSLLRFKKDSRSQDRNY